MKKFLYALLMISIGFSIKLVLDIIYDIQHNYPVDDDEYGEEDCCECACPCRVENTENEKILEDRYTP